MTARRSTIKDVAEDAQVSISTVSLVMNGKGYVSPETRSRVLKAATRLGYVPTRNARGLASKKTDNIGFILRDDHFTRSEPFYTRIFLGAEFEAKIHNVYVLLATVPSKYKSDEDMPRFLGDGNIDGLLVAGKVSDALLADARKSRIPVVLIDYEVDGYPAVLIDNRGGACTAVEHLLSQGLEDIAFVGADTPHPSIAARIDGYRLALTRSQRSPLREALIITDPAAEPTFVTGSRLAERLLALRPRPQAALCANDALALGLMSRLEKEGIRIPEDFAVVGFDDVTGAAAAATPLSSVRVFKEQLGELAMRYLMEMINRENSSRPAYDRGSHTVTVPGELVVRLSSRLAAEHAQ